jgi:ABC-type multidrug transport system fused ATPase/permease subunit
MVKLIDSLIKGRKKERIQKSVFFFALSRFDRATKIKLVIAQLLQTSLAFLDFVGVIIIGVMSSLAISGVSNGYVGNRVAKVLSVLGIEDSSLQTQVTVLGVIAACFLAGKTILSYFVTRRTLLFLSFQSARYSEILVREMLSRKLSSIQEESIQNSIYSVTGGARALSVGVVGGWFNLSGDVLLLLVLGGGLFFLDSTLTLIILVFYGLVALVLHQLVAKKLTNLGDKQAEISVAIGERISEIYLSFREIFVKNRRNFYSNYISKAGFESASNGALIGLTSMMSKFVFELAFVCGSLLVAGYAFANRPINSAVGILAIFLASSTRIVPALLRIQQGLASIRLQTGYARPTIVFMEKVEKIKLLENTSSPFSYVHAGFDPSIQINNLSFSFRSDSNWSLQIDELQVAAGEFIAIVGSSGAGKTTLVDLILGLREPTGGEIKISGFRPDDVIKKFPGSIAYMPQDIAIFPGSIRRNLCIGFEEDEIDEELLWEALTKASLDNFVRNLPDQLETQVAERGTRLSGGQRQRLGLARAFVSRPKLIILDEATSMLDAEVESAISESIRALKGSTTLLVIAHRLSTVRSCDRLYFLKEGTVAGSGDFMSLKEKLPDFAKQASLLGL